VNVALAYLGHSGVVPVAGGQAVQLAPNLLREPVAFDAPVLRPTRFREAICALHDCVISDHRYKPRDKSAYEAWKTQQAQAEQQLRRAAYDAAEQAALFAKNQPLPPGLDASFEAARRTYWRARLRYSDWLRKHDPAVWRQLLPCDPVITVADDAVLFECFSADESTYGCLSVRRDAFGRGAAEQLGTTNVDYSWELFHQLQSIRSYRETRFRIDPAGFEVQARAAPAYREEKIDLPQGWLRGFTTLQAGMTLPLTRVRLSRESVYSLLAFVKRHRARRSPRAMRFELLPGRPVRVVIEPWEQEVLSHDPPYDGPPTAPIRVWGTRRLVALARLLPLADCVDVYLVGTGLPSFWVVRMREMDFTLGLSGWTTNDWTRGSALDLLAPPAAPMVSDIDLVASQLRSRRRMTHADVSLLLGESMGRAVVRRLAATGQAIYDLPAGVYRWRQVMSQALGERELGPESEEVTAARTLVDRDRAHLVDRQDGPPGTLLLKGDVESKPVEILVDADEAIRRGKCLCGHYRKYGLRNGPCRHMIALRWIATSRSYLARDHSAT
jgi:hypothetical protein